MTYDHLFNDNIADYGGSSPQEQPEYGRLTDLAEAIEPPVRISLCRSENGTYSWSIAVHGDDGDDVLSRIRGIDQQLRETYRPGMGGER